MIGPVSATDPVSVVVNNLPGMEWKEDGPSLLLSVISHFLCEKEYCQKRLQSNESYCPMLSPCNLDT